MNILKRTWERGWRFGPWAGLWSPGGHDNAEPPSVTSPRRDGGGKTLCHRLAEEEDEKKSLIHSDKIWAPMNEENRKRFSSTYNVGFTLCVLLCSSSGWKAIGVQVRLSCHWFSLTNNQGWLDRVGLTSWLLLVFGIFNMQGFAPWVCSYLLVQSFSRFQ